MKKRKRYKWLAIICLLSLWMPAKVWAAQEQTEAKGYTGYVEVPHETYSIYEEGELPIVYEEELPDAYDAREHSQVLEVENQNPWGNCWSYCATAALEGSMRSQNPRFQVNLSEYHLNYYSYKSVTDPLGGTEGDSVTGNGSFEAFLDGGGNILVSYHALTNWMGAVSEAVTGNVPTSNPEELAGTAEDAYFNNSVHLQQMYQLSKEDVADVKKAIMEYGAVTASYYSNNVYLNQNTAGYYCERSNNPNHAIALVGWDDQYSKDNFKTCPDNDGAWLVKNSWGESFGKDGYFWLSYEDATIHDTICVLVGENADNYDYNYQYDGSFWDSYVQYSDLKAANVFRVPEKEMKEILKAVSFDLDSVNVNYSIQVYTNLTDMADPESGIPALTEPVVGKTSYQGYYTIPLSQEIALNPGDTFAVVITFSKGQDVVRLSTEQSGTWNNISFVAFAREGQSFYKSGSQTQWKDLGKISKKNLRIKAFTNESTMERDIRVSDISLTPESVEIMVGEAVTLQASISPANATNQKVDWYVEDESVATVDADGRVTALKRGKTLVYAVTRDGSYRASAQLDIYNKITLGVTEVELAVGESVQIPLLVNGEEQELSEYLLYTTEVQSEDVVIRTGLGKFEGRGKGSTLVTITGKEDKREKTSIQLKVRTDFEDIRTTDWSYPYIVYAYENGIMAGKSTDTFGTNGTLTRAEFVTMLYSYNGKEPTEYEECFRDVSEGYWYSNPIIWASKHDIVAGYGDGMFGVSDPITREQFVLMLYVYAKSQGIIGVNYEGTLSGFADGDKVSDWAETALVWATNNSLLQGKPLEEGTLYIDPQGPITRAEGATIITKFDMYVNR